MPGSSALPPKTSANSVDAMAASPSPSSVAISREWASSRGAATAVGSTADHIAPVTWRTPAPATGSPGSSRTNALSNLSSMAPTLRQMHDVLVIGGGAAGLMCAATAGRRGLRVLVAEGANRVGKKILMSGGGRCNFTNTGTSPANFLSSNPHFCKSALARYTPWHFIEMVERHGIAYHEKELGQLFCDVSSKQIVAMLLAECAAAGVRIMTSCTIDRVSHGDGFTLHTNLGEFSAPALVVASGGLSIPSMGASGFGYELARQFGHGVLPTRAGLVPLTLSGRHQERLADLSGVSLPVVASCNGQSFENQMLVTHRGISGPAILQVSSY